MKQRKNRFSKRQQNIIRRAIGRPVARVEALEDRTLLTVFSVTSVADSDTPGTLRNAINLANGSAGHDVIHFDINGGGATTIELTSSLPDLTEEITIDGSSQGGYATSDVPLIRIDGALGFFDGLRVLGGNSVIEALALTSVNNGITLSGGDGNTVQGCLIGLDPTDISSPDTGTFLYGIDVQSAGNVIGGVSARAGNVIVNSGLAGVHVTGEETVIRGNYIGVDPSGLVAMGNDGGGVLVEDAPADSGIMIDRNVISGNFGSGVLLRNSQGVAVTGNLIGTDATGLVGSVALGNTTDGITLEAGSANNLIGGNGASQRNVLSGNQGDGLNIEDFSTQNTVAGNYIGIAADGTVGNGMLGNEGQGIEVGGGASDNLIGAGNVISGNAGYGVLLSGSDNQVQGNLIGTGPDGSSPLGNGQDGIHIEGDGNVIGSGGAGPVVAANANVIAHNGFAGVAVGSGVGNSIRGNAIYDNGSGDGVSVGIDLLITPLNLDPVRGPNVNDGPQGHDGPNRFQNSPVLGLAVRHGGNVTVSGGLHAEANKTYVVDVYANQGAHPSGFGEGERYLDSFTVTTDSSGNGSFSGTLHGVAASEHFVTATATDDQGNTSEFSLVDPIAAEVTLPTHTSLSSSANPSVFGQGVTLTATVQVFAAPSTTFTGTVEFRDGAVVLGSAAVDAGGVATFAVAGGFSVGTHTLTAVYLGDGSTIEGSTSDPLNQQVLKAGTATGVSSSVNPSKYGQAVVLTASVTPVASGAGMPSGTIVFMDGVTVLGTVALSNGVATLTRSDLTVGSHLITAEYAGDGSFSGSVGFVDQAVQAAGTTTTLSSSINPSVLGQSVAFTATVSVVAPGAGAPAGSVQFFDGATLLGSAPLVGGSATFSTASLGVGAHNITAAFVGEARFTASTSDTLVQNVGQAPSQTGLSSSTNPTAYGQAVTFTATITTAAGLPAVTGTVTFKEGATVLGSAPVVGGSATFSTAGLSVGSHPITAIYGGDANFTGSTSPIVNQSVVKAASTVTLASSVNPSVVGQSVTLTAGVSVAAPGAATPSGTVTFKDGSTVLGTVTLVNGAASINVVFASGGGHAIVATYSGDANVSGSSAALAQNVNPAATTTTVASSANPSVVGQSVTFTASITAVAPGAGTPAGGIVTFRDGATVLGTAPLVGGVATFSTAGLAVGGHTITASYGGTGDFGASVSGPLNQTVNAAATSTLSGYVYVDRNNDGVKQASEAGISCVSLKLVNAAGVIVGSATTTCSGAYTFSGVASGVYTILETQPAHYVDGIESAGSLGGDASGDNNTISAIPVGSGQAGINYNFGELPEAFVDEGDTATIGFWHNKNGQALIKSLNGSANATLLASWLSSTFPHIYGSTSANSLVGKNNTDVAALFLRLFGASGQKLDAQVLGVALAVYSTTSSLGGTAAVKYGFTVDAIGTGHRLFNVTGNGAAFGVANNTSMEVLDILSACDLRAVNGVLYSGNTSLRNMANTVFDGINQQGDIA